MAEKNHPCWKIQACPSEKRDKCLAYCFKQNCWEAVSPISCCRRRNKARCTLCQVLMVASQNGLPVLPVRPETRKITGTPKGT